MDKDFGYKKQHSQSLKATHGLRTNEPKSNDPNDFGFSADFEKFDYRDPNARTSDIKPKENPSSAFGGFDFDKKTTHQKTQSIGAFDWSAGGQAQGGDFGFDFSGSAGATGASHTSPPKMNQQPQFSGQNPAGATAFDLLESSGPKRVEGVLPNDLLFESSGPEFSSTPTIRPQTRESLQTAQMLSVLAQHTQPTPTNLGTVFTVIPKALI